MKPSFKTKVPKFFDINFSDNFRENDDAQDALQWEWGNFPFGN